MTSHRSLLFISLGLILLLGVSHHLAGVFYLYWTVWWFDSAMHLLAGLSIGSLLFWMMLRFLPEHTVLNFRRVLGLLAAIMLVVGLGWEAFEYIFNISNPSSGESYIEDTIYDLIADMAGAIVAVFIIRKAKLHG